MARFYQHIQRDKVLKGTIDHAGTGLFAKDDIPAKDRIMLILRPLVAVLDTPRLKDTCYYCYRWSRPSAIGARPNMLDGSILKACSGCHVVYYCEKGCQTESWRSLHKYECKIFASLPDVLPNNVRAALQLLLLNEAKVLPIQEWEEFLKLKSHLNDFQARGGKTWDNLCLMAKATQKYSKTKFSQEFVRSLFARLFINSITLVTKTYDPRGLGLHPLLARFNHSCEYNATVEISGGAIRVRALKAIPAGDEILISYIDSTNPYHKRQAELQEKYFFKCQCSKCSMACLSPEDGFLDVSDDGTGLTVAKERVDQLVDSASKDTSQSGPVTKLKYALHVLHATSVWPVTRQPYAFVRQQLIVALLFAGQFNGAFAQAAIQYLDIDPVLFPDAHHPIRIVHNWVFYRLMVYLMHGLDWASQKLDLRSYDLHLGYIAADVLTKVEREMNVMVDFPISAMVRSERSPPRRFLVPSPDELAAEWDKVRKVANDALEAEKVWEKAG